MALHATTGAAGESGRWLRCELDRCMIRSGEVPWVVQRTMEKLGLQNPTVSLPTSGITLRCLGPGRLQRNGPSLYLKCP